MTTETRDPLVEQQATAMAEAIMPQLSSHIKNQLDAQAHTQQLAFENRLIELGLVNEHGDPIRPPAAPAADANRPFKSLGEQLQAIANSSGPSRMVDGRLAHLQGLYAATGMSEGVAGDGGFLLQDTYADDIFRKMHDTGQVFQRITRRFALTGNSNSIKMPAIDETSRADGSRWGGVRAYWTDEGGSLTASKPTFSRIALELNKLTALSYATNEQLADTPVIGTLVEEGFAEEMGFKLDDAAVRGNGVGEPLGVLVAAATVSVAKETGQAADTVVFENIVKMWSRLYARSRGNAVWFINQDVEPQLYALSLAVGTGGIPVYMPANGLSGSPFATLFGRPVVPIEQADTVGDQGDIILADYSQYWAITRGGINQASSMHVAFTTDEMAFRATFRTDYRPMWQSALTPFQSSLTLSPFVVLDARA